MLGTSQPWSSKTKSQQRRNAEDKQIIEWLDGIGGDFLDRAMLLAPGSVERNDLLAVLESCTGWTAETPTPAKLDFALLVGVFFYGAKLLSSYIHFSFGPQAIPVA